jgi:hypothetical protein
MASTTCPNCQTVVAAGTATCPSCGNSLFSAAPPPSSGPQHASSAPPSSGAQPKPQIKFDLASLGRVDRLVGGGTLVLFISLFLPWFSINFGGGLGTASASGLTAHGYLYIPLIISIAVVALLAAEALGLWKLPASAGISREQILLIATAINLVLVLIGFLAKPGGSGVGWDWGAFVGLIAAVVALFPLGWPIIEARRGK